MAKIKLGMNTGFANNRFPEPEVWTKIVGEELGLRYVQFVADLLNPFLPYRIIASEIKKIKENAKKYDVKIDTTFTSTYTRVNHLLHPDKEIKQVWFEWFKTFIIMTSELEARGTGGHFGIISVIDFSNLERRNGIIDEGIELWQELADFAKRYGLEFLIFEPMSIEREMASTIDDTIELLKKVNSNASIPVRLNLDVDHGNNKSGNPDDINPYLWLRRLGKYAPVVHIKQSSADKMGHWPFTEEYNKIGCIEPEKVINAIEESGADDVILMFEISHRERYPFEENVLSDIKYSVEYWRKFIKD